jgi:hypothetical protein
VNALGQPPLTVRNARRCWWLRQTNHELAGRLLAAANRAEPRDPDSWAARALVVAEQRGLRDGSSILLAAEMASTASLGPSSNDVNHLRSLAMALHGGSAAPALPIGGAASSLGAPVVHLRSEPAARSAYNHPGHWISTADGKLALDASRLHGESARLWAGLTTEFGAALAQSMFDAHVHGGAVAVIDAMNAAGSTKRLTQDHLAALHFVAFADGHSSTDPFGVFVATPDRPHDEEHAFTGFGVSWVEETYNNYAFEAARNYEAPVAATRPLRQQPQLVAELRSRWRRQLREFDFRSNLHVFVDPGTVSGPPAAAAARTERELQADGFLAHLSAAQRNELRSMLYGRGATPSSPQAGEDKAEAEWPTLETIAARFANGGNEDRLHSDLAYWSNRVTNLLVRAAEGNRLPDEVLLQSAARLFAFRLCQTRHPDSDLRVHYPPALHEVLTVLGLSP